MSYKSKLLATSSALVIGYAVQSGAVVAADMAQKSDLCAVSAPNGKLNVFGGVADDNTTRSEASFGGVASFSLPVGCDFGLQFDAGVMDGRDETTYGGMIHAFTRNPESYLLGVTGGYYDAGNGSIWAAGPEFELYAGQFSLEAWAGFANVDPDGGASDTKGFGFVDAALYATDDLRLSVGATVIGSDAIGRAELEYQVADPLSVGLQAKVGEDDYLAVSAGLTYYFGQSGGKSLIRRHREDDPKNRVLNMRDYRIATQAAAAVTTGGPTTTASLTTSPPPTTNNV